MNTRYLNVLVISVAHGSVPEPLIFILFINDDTVTNNADDNSAAVPTYQQNIKFLCCQNHLSINMFL